MSYAQRKHMFILAFESKVLHTKMQLLNLFWVNGINSWFYILEYISCIFVIPSEIWLFFMEYDEAKEYIGVARLVMQYSYLKAWCNGCFTLSRVY